MADDYFASLYQEYNISIIHVPSRGYFRYTKDLPSRIESLLNKSSRYYYYEHRLFKIFETLKTYKSTSWILENVMPYKIKKSLKQLGDEGFSYGYLELAHIYNMSHYDGLAFTYYKKAFEMKNPCTDQIIYDEYEYLAKKDLYLLHNSIQNICELFDKVVDYKEFVKAEQHFNKYKTNK